MELLGVVVNSKGFGMEDKKVKSVKDWPRPKNLKQLKGFIGFCNFYRRFIKGFSIIARPLHALDKKGTPWKWEQEQEKAFLKLKEMVASEPCLAHVDPGKVFRMETDASNFAYGATLSQKQEDQKYHPVAFMSKSMLPAEKNYDIYDKEALGVVKPLQHWRYWLQGTRKPIQIITDHRNLLTGFNNRPTPSKRHLRWVETLRHFNYVLGYRPGNKNSVADSLSRREDLRQGEEARPVFKPFSEDKMTPVEELDINIIGMDTEVEVETEEIALVLLQTDGDLQEAMRQWKAKNKIELPDHEEKEGLYIKEGRIWVPPDEEIRRKLVELYHDSPFTGHLGVAGTMNLVGRGYQWKGMQQYIRDYVTGCQVCIRAKKRNSRRHGTLNPLPVPEGPWLWTESDHIVKLPESKGFDSIYVIVDRFTKMAHFVPCTEAKGEEDIIDLHLKHVWKHHGLPLVHSTDRHGNFSSDYIKKLFKGLGIEQRFSTAYHPQTQGQVENLNGWLETYLRMFCDHQKKNWSGLLHLAEFAWNNHYHHSIKTTPFFANYARHPVLTDRAPLEEASTPNRIQRIHEVQKDIEGDLHLAQRIQKEAV
jgi:transposase InsO family protein